MAQKWMKRYVLFTIWTGNAIKMGKMTRSLKKKKRSFWRSTIFDHLSPCGFVNFINVW